MARGKRQMKRIESPASRQVTFSKRRKGLFKKANELSVLCDAEVSLIVFSPSGKLYEFSNPSMQTSIERYQSLANKFRIHNYGLEHNLQKLKFEVADNKKKIGALEVLRGRLMGEGLNECSLEELKLLQKQLELSITNIRDRKDQLFNETINQLNERVSSVKHIPYHVMAHNIDFPLCYTQEKNLIDEQVTLREKFVGQMEQPMELSEIVPYRQSSEDSCEVETELFIGWPPPRRANPLPLQTL